MKQLSFLLAALLLVGLVSAADAVCPAGQVLDQRNITGTITFSLVKNTGNGNMVPLVYANGNRELFNGSQSFPLFVDGARVTDAHFSPNSVGVVLHRKSTGLSLTFKGSHTRGSELVIANLSLSGATFGKFTNSKDGNYKMENPRNGVINPLHSNDEVIDITPSLLTIYSGTSTGNDRFFVKVVPSCHVPPPPACSDGVDTDHDGFTDLADFGCMGADDIDETNNGNTQCSDGIDNDADGTFDEEDSQCSNAADNTETFPTSSHLCPAGQLLVTPNISMSVVFDYLKNTGAGNLDNQVFYNNGRSTAASGQPILLATDGVFVEDTLTGLNKPGIVLRRSVRNLLVHFQGSNPHGSESVQATMTLSGATFGAFKNAASELNRMETPRNGIATFTGDDEVTTVAPNQIRVVSTTSTANDRFYIEVVPSCQIVSACNDGVDNDRDGYTDLADFGCVNAADTSEVNNGATQCSDGLDNDADGRIDQADSDCTGPTDAYETFLCVQDNDCTLGANGPLICTGDNVTQTQGPATCVNAGT
ncbi:MAG: hypothetical protein Q7S65_04415, partial [Nanoarchaeota archaeon]|nr:hypothetical protein [Nanoarchaeota archaeon]